jgi:hypothetical protein
MPSRPPLSRPTEEWNDSPNRSPVGRGWADGSLERPRVEQVYAYPKPKFGSYTDRDDSSPSAAATPQASASSSLAPPGLSRSAFGLSQQTAAPHAGSHRAPTGPLSYSRDGPLLLSDDTSAWSVTDPTRSAVLAVSSATGGVGARDAPSAGFGATRSRRNERDLASMTAWMAEFEQRMETKLAGAELHHQRRMDEHSRELDRRAVAKLAAQRVELEAAERERREEQLRRDAEAAEEDARRQQHARDLRCVGMTPAEREAWERDEAELEALEAKLNRHESRLHRYGEYAEEEYGKFLASEAHKAKLAAQAAAELVALRNFEEFERNWDFVLFDRSVDVDVEYFAKYEFLARSPLVWYEASHKRESHQRSRDRVLEALPSDDQRRLERMVLGATTEAEGVRRRDAVLDDHLEMEALKRHSKTLRKTLTANSL